MTTSQDGPCRTVVLIDYQNMYRSAREAFGWTSKGGHFGNFRPLGFGLQTVRAAAGVLTEVRVYTGIHTPRGNIVQNAHMQRRMSAWIAEAPDTVQVLPRPLRYSRQRPQGEEKGVDVELAIDLTRLALDDQFDVAVLASGDTDLVPALQLVADRFADKALVTVGWKAERGNECPAPLDLPRGAVRRIRIAKRDFDVIADKRNFYRSASDLSAAVDPKRWQRIKRRYERPS